MPEKLPLRCLSAGQPGEVLAGHINLDSTLDLDWAGVLLDRIAKGRKHEQRQSQGLHTDNRR